MSSKPENLEKNLESPQPLTQKESLVPEVLDLTKKLSLLSQMNYDECVQIGSDKMDAIVFRKNKPHRVMTSLKKSER